MLKLVLLSYVITVPIIPIKTREEFFAALVGFVLWGIGLKLGLWFLRNF